MTVPTLSPGGLRIQWPGEYIEAQPGIPGWDRPYYPQDHDAAFALQKLITIVDHPEGIDSHNAIKIANAFWLYMERNDFTSYYGYTFSRMTRDFDGQRALDAIKERQDGGRVVDPANPFHEFKHLAGRVPCTCCTGKFQRQTMAEIEGILVCRSCISTYYVQPLDRAGAYFETGNCHNLSSAIGHLAPGWYTREYLRDHLYLCWESGSYFADASAHLASRCCA